VGRLGTWTTVAFVTALTTAGCVQCLCHDEECTNKEGSITERFRVRTTDDGHSDSSKRNRRQSWSMVVSFRNGKGIFCDSYYCCLLVPLKVCNRRSQQYQRAALLRQILRYPSSFSSSLSTSTSSTATSSSSASSSPVGVFASRVSYANGRKLF
jgi:hypothetical protein